MDTVTYPNEQIGGLIEEYCVPVRCDILEERELARELDARWTPTIVFVDPEGRLVHRVFGFLPPDEFAPQILVAAGHAAALAGDWEEAQERFRAAADGWPNSDVAPEAVYWAGVSGFRIHRDTSEIYDACREIVDRWPGHIWARKVGFVRRYENFDVR